MTKGHLQTVIRIVPYQKVHLLPLKRKKWARMGREVSIANDGG